MTAALLCVDLINECLSPEGKLSDQYVEFEKKHDVLQRISRIQEHFREQGKLVVHVRTGYNKNYPELSKQCSPVFKEVQKMGACQLGESGTDFPKVVAPREGEPVINKFRLGSFYRTRLEIVLRSQEVSELYIVGLATGGSVLMTALEAHDFDFSPTVIKDACIAMSDERHAAALEFIEQAAEVKDFKDVAVRLTMESMKA